MPSSQIEVDENTHINIEYILDECIKYLYEDVKTLREERGLVQPQDVRMITDSDNAEGIKLAENRLLMFEKILENGYHSTMGYFQKKVAARCVAAMAPGIIGDKYWDKLKKSITKKRRWPEKHKRLIVVEAARQIGKSTLIARIMSTRSHVFINGPFEEEDVQVVFSLAKKISLLLQQKFTENLSQLNLSGYICKNNQDVVTLKNSRGVTQFNYFLPGKANTNRGFSPRVMIGEEAAFMEPQIWTSVMVPLIENKKCTTILISTPPTTPNFFTELFNVKNTEDMVDAMRLDMVCDDCNIGPNPQLCTHNDRYIPSWKSPENRQLVMDLLGDKKATFLRESMGNITSNINGYFTKMQLDNVFREKEFDGVPISHKFKEILVVCDPNVHNSENSSEMYLGAVGVYLGLTLIIGIDSYKAKNGEEASILLDCFIRNIRKDPRFEHARIIFCPEKGTGHEDTRMSEELIRKFKGISVISWDGTDDYGLYTTRQSKIDAIGETFLIMKEKTLKFINNWVCDNPLDRSLDRRDLTKSKLRSQLENYKIHNIVDPTTERSKNIVSGRRDENGKVSAHKRDDLAFGMCFAIYVLKNILNGEYKGISISR